MYVYEESIQKLHNYIGDNQVTLMASSPTRAPPIATHIIESIQILHNYIAIAIIIAFFHNYFIASSPDLYNIKDSLLLQVGVAYNNVTHKRKLVCRKATKINRLLL